MTATGTSPPTGGLAGGLECRPSYFDLLARPDWSSANGQAWLLTFADLMALMLAFFVLLFSMSQIEQRKWEGLVEALSSDLNSLRKVENFKPAVEYQPEEEAVAPGTNLAYLTPVIREQIGAHPLLVQAAIHRAPERLVISLPTGLLFDSGAAVPAPQAVELGSALVSVLRNLSNSVEVEARIERGGAVRARYADWELALARATAFTGILTRAGYAGRIVARATGPTDRYGGPTSGPAGRQGARLYVVIHESERELR